jgi:RNA polymerase sigma factor (sigma-70 family)
MSYEIAGRRGWLSSWLDHWRGRDHAEGSAGAMSDLDESNRDASRCWSQWIEESSVIDADQSDADDDGLSQAVAVKHLREVVEQLPPNERQVLLLHVNSGLTYWEIAERLEMAEEVVLRDLARAYSQLRLELSMEELRR